MSVFEIPRYKENPIYLFFESYILNTLGFVSSDRYRQIQEMNIQKVFDSSHSDWPLVVEEVLDLSDTIHIAIKHLWLKNMEYYYEFEEGYLAFAQDFTDNYMKAESEIDIWTKESLASAITYINSSGEFDV
ncbi:hypothetical protein A9267_20580 [Shewanella sp. UCD-FRSSP16_17]|uniref:hypothetical protein n=1 Tax=Shewanella sp. UCD-FRSSP16_17 TaxID=1853256 RepID=UPI0007EEC653|nr:hypothetical protein [Shewanella sp. UCD-FRSSP16_17]OBT09622.1 hypothetical protein A9267_20580 [Shewanella sp. UCD-FRSSP16_17]